MEKKKIKEKKNVSVRAKLTISYTIFVVLIFAIGIVTAYSMGRVHDNGNVIYKNSLRSVDILKTVNQNLRRINLYVRECFEDANEDLDSDVAKLLENNKTLLAEYEELDVGEEEKLRYAESKGSLERFESELELILSDIHNGELDTAKDRYTEDLSPIRTETYQLLEDVVTSAEKNADACYKDNQIAYKNLLYTVIALVGVSSVLALGMALYVNKMLKKRLESIGFLAERMSEYDISEDIRFVSQDEFGEITEALNGAQLMMRDLLSKITAESDDMAAISMDLMTAVEKTGNRIEQTNLTIYDTEAEIETIQKSCLEIIARAPEQEAEVLQRIMDNCEEQREILKNVQAELTAIISQMGQIGIIASQQNEISTLHKDQIGKFKINAKE